MQRRTTGRWYLVLAALLSTRALAAPPPSVVFLLLDTTRADRFGAWGHRDRVTPAFDALARRGVVFRRHYANANATRTSMPQLMSGRYYHRSILTPYKTFEHPREFEFNRADPTAALLPAILLGAGYRTLGVSAHNWVAPGCELARHFDAFELVACDPEDGYPEAAPVIDRAIALWQTRDEERPVFLYVHLMDMHLPRRLPAGAEADDATWDERFTADSSPRFDRERRRWDSADARDFTATDSRLFARRYDQRLRYADAQFARLLAVVEHGDPGLERTLVVVTADHGDELGEDGRTDHTQALADGVQHIPWIVAGAGVHPAQIARRITENVDVTPTLLSLVGVATPPGVRMDGRAQMTPDGFVCRACGRATAVYASEEYRGIRAGRHLLREERAGSPRARCLGERQLYRMDHNRRTPVDEDRSVALTDALRRRLARVLDEPEHSFATTRHASVTRSVLFRTQLWQLDGDPPACAVLDMDTPRGVLRTRGWLWTGRGLVHLGDEPNRPLHARVQLPDGEYQIDAALVHIERPPWLFGFRRWLRKSFVPEMPDTFVPLARVAAADGWLRFTLPPPAAADGHVVGLRVTPAGVTPRRFGPDTDGADEEQLQRLRALGYVQ
jgi:hypothetical protein